MVTEVTKYHYYSTLKLKSAYQQILFNEPDRRYTAFEANGRLYHSCVLAFGLTNGVACFQWMASLFSENALQGTFAYVDNINICGEPRSDMTQI